MNGLSLSHPVFGSPPREHSSASHYITYKAGQPAHLLERLYGIALVTGLCGSLEPFGSLSEARAGVPSHCALTSSSSALIKRLSERETFMHTFSAYLYAHHELSATGMQHRCCL